MTEQKCRRYLVECKWNHMLIASNFATLALYFNYDFDHYREMAHSTSANQPIDRPMMLCAHILCVTNINYDTYKYMPNQFSRSTTRNNHIQTTNFTLVIVKMCCCYCVYNSLFFLVLFVFSLILPSFDIF